MRSGVRRSRFSGSRFAAVRAVICVLASALATQAADLLSGRIYTVPEKVYVNQAFEIHFELEVTTGSEVEDLRISDFPNDPRLLTLGRLETTSRTAAARDGQAVSVLHYVAAARGHQPIEQTFSPLLQCSLVQRRNAGFFSQWQSAPRQLPLGTFALHIRPLPAAGRPAHFSGAVGQFRLTGRLSQQTVRPGDIVTLVLDLSGKGWLGEAAAPAPPPDPRFKTYPVKERVREPLHLQTEQVLIPQTTNATEIAAARFCFFNPEQERYEESVAGPFKLTFSETAAAPETAEVRVLDTVLPAAAEVPPQTVSLERVNMTLRRVVPLLIACAGAAAAFFVFFLLYGRHTRLAFVCGAALLAGGLAAGYAASGRTETAARTTSRHTDALFAPSRTAAKLFALNAGVPVTPLEKAGAWIRVDAAGRRGWIPSDALQDPASSAAAPKPAR